MRPRSSDRGEPALAVQALRDREALQCGHGLRTVENDRRGTLTRTLAIFGFNAATVFGPWRTPKPLIGAPAGRMLQCGHGLRTVENFESTLAGERDAMLQCGHGLRTVENPAGRGTGWRAGGRFNAATVFGPWRTHVARANAASPASLQCGHGLRTVENDRSQARRRGPEHELQCGHGLRTVENPRPAGGEAVIQRGFNAATVFGPWRTPERNCWPTSPPRSRFNAATVFGPWRTARVVNIGFHAG